MRGVSVRVRLTLWNMGILALVLLTFGAVLDYAVRATQSAALDRDLASRVNEFLSASGPPAAEDQPPRAFAFRARPLDSPLVFDRHGRSRGPFAGIQPWDQVGYRRALRGIVSYATLQSEGEPIRVYTRPRVRKGAVDEVVQIAYPLAEQNRLTESLHSILLLLMPASLLVAGLAGLFLTNRALSPVRRVTETAARIGAEALSERLDVRGDDEFAQLSRTFNEMISRLDLAFENREEAFRHLEQAYLEQRRFAGDASHELRTPLARIKGSTSLALSGPHDAGEYREALEVADAAADRMAGVVQDLLLLARADAGRLCAQRQAVILSPLLEEAALSFQRPGGPVVTFECHPPNVRVGADGGQLLRILLNLSENAVRHTPPHGRVSLSGRELGPEVLITVGDTGEGIAPEHLPHVCERFYRVDSARTGGAHGTGGTGLGLAICRSLVAANGGSMELESLGGCGTTVRLRFPRWTTEDEPPHVAAGCA